MIDNMLFSVGAAKAGTTWLYKQLCDHPEIYFPPEKEIHYFFSKNGWFNRLTPTIRYEVFQRYVGRSKNRKFIELEREMYWYMRYLRGPVDDFWFDNLFLEGRHFKYSADFSNSTSLMDAAGWSHIKRLVRNPKFIYTLRDPVERLWSHAKFHLKWIGEEHKLDTWSEQEIIKFAGKEFLRRDGEYVKNIGAMLKEIEKDQLLLLFFENVISQPEKELHAIEAFLGVEPVNVREKDLKKKVNASRSMAMPEAFRDHFRAYAEKEIKGLKGLGLEVPNSWAS